MIIHKILNMISLYIDFLCLKHKAVSPCYTTYKIIMNSAFAVFLLNACRYILLKAHLFVLSANRLFKNIQNFITSDLKPNQTKP